MAKKEVFLRTEFNYDRDAASAASGLSCQEPTRAQQQFKAECDINTIVRRFGITRELPQGSRLPQYGDFSQVVDFQTAMNAVRHAEEQFSELPSSIRARFANDPQSLMVFLADDQNRAEAIKLGLVSPPITPPPIVNPVASPEAPDPIPPKEG